MGRRNGARPSPALIVAVLALVAAVAGTAVAANPVATTSAVSKKQVRKIAKREAKKIAVRQARKLAQRQIAARAPRLSAARANTATSAGRADRATSAGRADTATSAQTANTATSVQNANRATSAGHADTATTAETANAANPIAFARVAADGGIVAEESKNVSQANLTHAGTGIYCLSELGFSMKGASVTPHLEESGPLTTAALFATGDPRGACPAGAQAAIHVVDVYNDVPVDRGFYIVLYD